MIQKGQMLRLSTTSYRIIRVMERSSHAWNTECVLTHVPPVCRVARGAMGCLFEVVIWEEDAERAHAIAEEALDEVSRLDRQLSHYRPDSDISRLNAFAAHEKVRVEPELFRLLEACLRWHEELEAAFDIACGALLECWGFHRGSGRIPSREEVSEALAASGSAHVRLEPDGCFVAFAVPGLLLNLGSVGKGYALDRAADVLRGYGVGRALLHAGQSTIVTLGPPPDADAWTFPVRDPVQPDQVVAICSFRTGALSTSGNYEQYVEANGKRYGHILDPRHGWPVSGVLKVSALAEMAAYADALSTGLFVLGPEGAVSCAKRHGGIKFVMLSEGPDGVRLTTNMGVT